MRSAAVGPCAPNSTRTSRPGLGTHSRLAQPSCRRTAGRLELRAAAEAAPGTTSTGSVAAQNGATGALGAGAGSDAAADANNAVPFRSTAWAPAEPATQPAHGPVAPPAAAQPASWPSAAARQGLYSDCKVERVENLYASVKGKLPAWLHGSFYRNGPGLFSGAHALFDGCAMLVRFRLDGGSNEAVLSHRFLDSVYYKAVKEQGSIRWKMAHPPHPGKTTLQGLAYASGVVLGALQYGRHLGDNACISIYPQGHELIAHTETLSGTYRIHPETLETLGRVQYKDDIHGMVKTAHMHRNPRGDIIGLAADFTPMLDRSDTLSRLVLPEITLYRQSPWQPDRRHKIASVPYLRPTSPTWIHEVPVSEHYAVVVQCPVFYNVRAMMMGQVGDFMVFDWKPELGTLLHVVNLVTGETKCYTAPAFLATHYVNAFESDGGRLLHLDAVVTDSPALLSHFELDTVRAGPGGKQIEDSVLRRLTIDLSLEDGSFLGQQPLLQELVPDELHGHAVELPSINPAKAGLPYRYVYGASCVRPSNCWNALSKLDVATGEATVWHEPGGATWEPIFVARPGAKAEDDGCVLATIMQPDGCSALLVLDAKTWQEVARVVLPYPLPNGFHGCFVPA